MIVSLVSLVCSQVQRGAPLPILAVDVGVVLVEELLQNTKVTVVGLNGNKNQKLHLHVNPCVVMLLAFDRLHVHVHVCIYDDTNSLPPI